MNPSMVMSYLSDLDCNSNVEVNIVRSEICDQIEITTDDLFLWLMDMDCIIFPTTSVTLTHEQMWRFGSLLKSGLRII